MPTLFQHPDLGPSEETPQQPGAGYSMPREMDTQIPPPPKPVLGEISVDGVSIPEMEILREAQNHPSENPGQALQAAAQALVIRQLLLNEADRLGISHASMDEDQTSETREEAVIRELLDGEVWVPTATEAECLRFFEANKARFMSPPIYEARHILISASEDEPDRRQRAHEQAQALCEELSREPSRFGDLAKTHSDCPSASQGGNLGQLMPGSTVAEFETMLGQMIPGTITTSPVATLFGFHIIALDRAINAQGLPFSSVQEKIAAWLEAQAWSRAMAQYVSLLADKAEICGLSLSECSGPSSTTQAP